MEKVCWGIIGCGDVTEVKSGPAFQKVSDSELVAVMRRNGAKAQDYALRHGVPRWYDNAEALIRDPDVNAIYIATPPLYHEEYTLHALDAGKPVYVEKPMALDARAAQRMAAAAAENGLPLTVAHYRREQPLFRKIRSLLREEAIGKVLWVSLRMFLPHQSDTIAATETNWRLDPAVSGGGLFHDLAPHQLDLMVHFFGKPLRASGIALNQAGHYKADDTVAGEILFEAGVLFQGLWSFAAPASYREDEVVITGTEGRLRFAVFAGNEIRIERKGEVELFSFEKLPHVQQPMIEATVQYFRGNGANPCSAEEGVCVMELMEKITGHLE